MKNDRAAQEEADSWNKLYSKDLLVIGPFLAHKIGKKYRLYFKDGTQIIAELYTCGDSDN